MWDARTLLPLAAGAALALGVVAPAGPSYAASSTTAPDYEMPFPCGDGWSGGSRAGHSPSSLAIDWNRPDDFGDMVVSPAPGVVTSVTDLGNRSYGRYVVVDHGDGRTTLVAHLSAFWATVGQAVDQGTPLGLVGSTGGSTGPHLHFEERRDRADRSSYFHRTSFAMGSTLASRNCGEVPVMGDWDGNGTDNVGVLRHSTSPSFSLRRPGRPALSVPFGWRTDQPLSGDWDGDGTVEVGVRRPSTQQFLLRSSGGAASSFTLGRVSDQAVAGDWNGDRRTDVAVWHPATQVFTLRTTGTGATRTVTLGAPGDRPVAGDWNGDGRDDLGVYSAGTQTFTLRTVARSGSVSTRQVGWGTSSALAVAGDWNGDGTGDVGVWEPATATFSLRVTPTAASRTASRTTTWGTPRG
jgi:hypothetical protein